MNVYGTIASDRREAVMPHYRDTRRGEFLVAPEQERGSGPRGAPSFVRFCGMHGVVGDLLSEPRRDPRSLLDAAELNWRVDHRPVLTELNGEFHRYPVTRRSCVRTAGR